MNFVTRWKKRLRRLGHVLRLCVRSEGRATAALLPEIATGQKFARDFPASDAGGFREYDGGHTYEQQRVTLEELFPHLRPGGVYICEDIHGMGNPFFGYLVGIAAALNDFQWDRTHRAIPLTGIAKYIEAIELRPYLAVITKHAAIRAQLVSRKQGTQWAPFPLR